MNLRKSESDIGQSNSSKKKKVYNQKQQVGILLFETLLLPYRWGFDHKQEDTRFWELASANLINIYFF